MRRIMLRNFRLAHKTFNYHAWALKIAHFLPMYARRVKGLWPVYESFIVRALVIERRAEVIEGRGRYGAHFQIFPVAFYLYLEKSTM